MLGGVLDILPFISRAIAERLKYTAGRRQ
jgi:hypothetical protein